MPIPSVSRDAHVGIPQQTNKLYRCSHDTRIDPQVTDHSQCMFVSILHACIHGNNKAISTELSSMYFSLLIFCIPAICLQPFHLFKQQAILQQFGESIAALRGGDRKKRIVRKSERGEIKGGVEMERPGGGE